jgi:hypothetical protein
MRLRIPLNVVNMATPKLRLKKSARNSFWRLQEH